ncbi:MAG: nitroreductase family protein [Bacteroidales bacterium]|nr:nitroreductase family protein [Bacteroidales bacterium]
MTTEEQILVHRSVRKFTSRAIPADVLERVLTCGGMAPNTGNMQIYSIVVTQEASMREELSKLHFGQCVTAPALLTICVDVNRYHHWCRLRGCDEPYSNLLWLMSGTVDASLAAQNINNAAESEGLGCCFLGTVMYNTEAIARLLELPRGVVPVITMAVGYPDGETRQSERMPLEGIVHYEKYHDYSDADIDRVHQLREEFPFNKEMVELNGVRNLAELFTTKRYPRKDNEAISASLRQFCEQAGMM